jgi:hypothetical protein
MENRFIIIQNHIFSEVPVNGSQVSSVMFVQWTFPGLDVSSVKQITYGSKSKDEAIIWKVLSNKMPIQALFTPLGKVDSKKIVEKWSQNDLRKVEPNNMVEY